MLIAKDLSVKNTLTLPPSKTGTSGTFIQTPTETLSPAEIQSLHGKGAVTAISLGPKVNAAMVVRKLIPALLDNHNFYGFQGGKATSVSVICSDKTSAKLLISQFPAAVESGALDIKGSLTNSPSNYFQPEGRGLIHLSIEKKRDVLVLILPPPEGKTKVPMKDLPTLLSSVRKRGESIVLVFQGLTTEDSQGLTSYIDVVFTAVSCEPDFGYTSAWIVAHAPGTLLAAIGTPPMIDNVRLNSEHQIENSSYECSSSDAMTREIVRRLDEGQSYAAIAKALGLHKTTVMRRVDALPFNPKRRLSTDD